MIIKEILKNFHSIKNFTLRIMQLIHRPKYFGWTQVIFPINLIFVGVDKNLIFTDLQNL